MKESISLRKRFCKDYNLPINLYDSPYFEQRLEALDRHFNCVHRYELFMGELERFQTEEEYFAYYNQVKDSAIQFIQSRSGYEEFTNSKVPTLREFPKKELYSDCNDGKTFFSIDMRKANFTTLSKLYPDLVGGEQYWEEFLSKFTDLEHILLSKYIRQVVLGACCPKKQTQWEKFLMENLCMSIEGRLPLCRVISVNTDEILIESESPCSMSSDSLLSIIERDTPFFEDMLKVSKFVLKKIEGFGWVKQFVHAVSTDALNGAYEFKCVESDKYHILSKLYRGEGVSDDDLVFYHNGMLATYLDKGNFKLPPSFSNPS